MNNKFLITSVVSAIALFALGGFFYAFLLADFFEAAAGVEGLYKDPPDFLFLVVGELFTASAITLVVVVWSGANDFMAGLKNGAMFGLLIGVGFSLTFYATSYIGDLTSSSVDVLITIVRFGVTGGVAALMMSKLSGSDE
jgi:hypothetical protein